MLFRLIRRRIVLIPFAWINIAAQKVLPRLKDNAGEYK
jgi:hypothetical protein